MPNRMQSRSAVNDGLPGMQAGSGEQAVLGGAARAGAAPLAGAAGAVPVSILRRGAFATGSGSCGAGPRRRPRSREVRTRLLQKHVWNARAESTCKANTFGCSFCSNILTSREECRRPSIPWTALWLPSMFHDGTHAGSG